jgi:hypothetical protein
MQLWLRPQRRASRVGFDGSNQEQGNGWEAEGAGSPAGCGLAWLDSVWIPRVQAWWRGRRSERNGGVFIHLMMAMIFFVVGV